mmetsp:Transcript_49892/g.60293  ORF Transcript_49892/g.60293 Transcript_49892/m.60293 type:complete len:89 (-) Transcript_49892:2-268(-)
MQQSQNDPVNLQAVNLRHQSSWGRLVRAPLKKKGHVIIDYCARETTIEEGETREEGRLVRNIVSKKSELVAPGMFHAARKASWGGALA